MTDTPPGVGYPVLDTRRVQIQERLCTAQSSLDMVWLYPSSSLVILLSHPLVAEETLFFLPLYRGRRLSRMTQPVKMLLQVLEKSNWMVSKIRSRISLDWGFCMKRRDRVEP